MSQEDALPLLDHVETRLTPQWTVGEDPHSGFHRAAKSPRPRTHGAAVLQGDGLDRRKRSDALGVGGFPKPTGVRPGIRHRFLPSIPSVSIRSETPPAFPRSPSVGRSEETERPSARLPTAGNERRERRLAEEPTLRFLEAPLDCPSRL
jgi:hypothetical protein